MGAENGVQSREANRTEGTDRVYIRHTFTTTMPLPLPLPLSLTLPHNLPQTLPLYYNT